VLPLGTSSVLAERLKNQKNYRAFSTKATAISKAMALNELPIQFDKIKVESQH
jgi:hypothetical protein